MSNKEKALAVVSDDGPLKPEALLYAALARAVADAQKVAKDAVNAFHKYKYASAEAVIEECRGPLSDHGLTLLPTSCVVDDGRSVMRAMYLVTHAMGGSLELGPFELAYVPGKGRPDDKAQLASRTELLGYANRDLLNLPRGDVSVSGRDDTKTPNKKTKPPPPKLPPNKKRKDGGGEVVHTSDAGDVIVGTGQPLEKGDYGEGDIETEHLTINEVKARIKQRKEELGERYCYDVVAADQIDTSDSHAILACLDTVRDDRLAMLSTFWALAKRLGWEDMDASDDLRERFEVNDPTELTPEQLEEVMLSMRESIKERG